MKIEELAELISITDPSKFTEKTVIPWGKYKGYRIQNIIDFDPGYCLWLVKKNLTSFKTSTEDYLRAETECEWSERILNEVERDRKSYGYGEDFCDCIGPDSFF